jgi:hypothetical protein
MYRLSKSAILAPVVIATRSEFAGHTPKCLFGQGENAVPGLVQHDSATTLVRRGRSEYDINENVHTVMRLGMGADDLGECRRHNIRIMACHAPD